MTDISVQSTGLHAEKRGWLAGEHGTEPGANPSITLDVSAFTDLVDGSIPSGTLLTRKGGKYAPAAEGETPAGLLFSTVRVVRADGSKASTVGGALFVHGFVNAARLPKTVSPDMQAKLPLIVWYS